MRSSEGTAVRSAFDHGDAVSEPLRAPSSNSEVAEFESCRTQTYFNPISPRCTDGPADSGARPCYQRYLPCHVFSHVSPCSLAWILFLKMCSQVVSLSSRLYHDRISHYSVPQNLFPLPTGSIFSFAAPGFRFRKRLRRGNRYLFLRNALNDKIPHPSILPFLHPSTLPGILILCQSLPSARAVRATYKPFAYFCQK